MSWGVAQHIFLPNFWRLCAVAHGPTYFRAFGSCTSGPSTCAVGCRYLTDSISLVHVKRLLFSARSAKRMTRSPTPCNRNNCDFLRAINFDHSVICYVWAWRGYDMVVYTRHAERMLLVCFTFDFIEFFFLCSICTAFVSRPSRGFFVFLVVQGVE